jgi:hypothetical protein
VAVLLTHMLSSALAVMKPPTRAAGRAPKARSTSSATRRCRSQRSIASAMMNPPMKRKMIGLA